MGSGKRRQVRVRIAARFTAVLAAGMHLTAVASAADPAPASTPAATTASKPANKTTPARPNILLVMVDDMGFSDLGAFGSEIRTPNLDALAQAGLRLTNFHTPPVCAPTRAELLTGVDHHQTGIGNFPELRQDNQKDKPGYEGYLTDKVATIAERLQSAGYVTFMSGKWHLGYDPRANPAVRGFDHSFVLLGGGHNHFGRDPNYKAVIPNAGTVYTEDGKTVPTPQPFYSSDYFTQRLMISCLRRAATSRSSGTSLSPRRIFRCRPRPRTSRVMRADTTPAMTSCATSGLRGRRRSGWSGRMWSRIPRPSPRPGKG